LNKLVKYNYDGIEYNISNPFEVDIDYLKNITRSYGLEVAAISTGLSYRRYGYSLSSINENIRLKAIEFFKKYIEIAAKLEAYKVVIGLARGKCEDNCQAALKRLEKSLDILDKYATEYGTILLLEPLNHYETDLINRLDEALRFIKQYNNLKLLFDTFHVMLEEQNIYEAILKVGKYIGHFHAADSNRRAPGMGILDWEKILFRLLRVGYQGYISIEARIEPSIDEMLEVGAKTLNPLIKNDYL